VSRNLLYKGACIVLAIATITVSALAQNSGTTAEEEIPALKISVVDDKLAPAGWTRYQIDDPAIFSAIFPRQPEAKSAHTSGSDGGSLVRSYIASSDTAGYGIVYLTDQEGTVEVKTDEQKKTSFNNFIHGFANGFLGIEQGKENPKFRITTERQVRISNLDGYEKEFILGDFQGRAQMLFMGRKKFVVVAFWNEKNPVNERDTFFSAFILNPQR
jgi:hypothetical protein